MRDVGIIHSALQSLQAVVVVIRPDFVNKRNNSHVNVFYDNIWINPIFIRFIIFNVYLVLWDLFLSPKT
jgi:hypothetical protein